MRPPPILLRLVLIEDKGNAKLCARHIVHAQRSAIAVGGYDPDDAAGGKAGAG